MRDTDTGNTARGLNVMYDQFRGIHVEGLVEEGLRSRQHLEQLLKALEARRHVSFNH
jgi:hypothetical protein